MVFRRSCVRCFPIDNIDSKNVKFIRSKACEQTFQWLKDSLTSALVLTLQEDTKGFMVYYDTSRVGLGCVLMQ